MAPALAPENDVYCFPKIRKSQTAYSIKWSAVTALKVVAATAAWRASSLCAVRRQEVYKIYHLIHEIDPTHLSSLATRAKSAAKAFVKSPKPNGENLSKAVNILSYLNFVANATSFIFCFGMIIITKTKNEVMV